MFIGSVFSPYYAWSRRRGRADPQDHCAVNIALHGPRGKRWAMTERPRASVRRFPRTLRIGASALSWDGNMLTLDIDEVTAPIPSRIRGTVKLYPADLSTRQIALDPAGIHHWWPIAPSSRVEVELEQPSLRWSGPGYLDSNMGDAPLEDSFTGWSWSRAKAGERTTVLYDVASRAGADLSLALSFDSAGRVEAFEPPPRRALPPTGWRIARDTRADAGHDPQVLRTLESGPFYARSLLATRILGEDATAIHESLSLDRFRSGIVRAMLPFRMPRWPL